MLSCCCCHCRGHHVHTQHAGRPRTIGCAQAACPSGPGVFSTCLTPITTQRILSAAASHGQCPNSLAFGCMTAAFLNCAGHMWTSVPSTTPRDGWCLPVSSAEQGEAAHNYADRQAASAWATNRPGPNQCPTLHLGPAGAQACCRGHSVGHLSQSCNICRRFVSAATRPLPGEPALQMATCSIETVLQCCRPACSLQQSASMPNDNLKSS